MNREAPRSQRAAVATWALWDFGATGLNAVVITFVFSVYLTEQVGAGLPGDSTPASWLGRALTIAGVCVALLAPATGVLVNAAARRRTALAVLTGLVVALTAMMGLIRADHSYFLAGLALLAGAAACSDLATVPYNAMLRGLSDGTNSGKISGLGSGAGLALLRGLGGDATRLLYTVGWHEVPLPAELGTVDGTWLIAGFNERGTSEAEARRHGRAGFNELADQLASCIPFDPSADAMTLGQVLADAQERGGCRSPAWCGGRAKPRRANPSPTRRRGWTPRSRTCSARCTPRPVAG